jgi:hypothetical protein
MGESYQGRRALGRNRLLKLGYGRKSSTLPNSFATPPTQAKSKRLGDQIGWMVFGD